MTHAISATPVVCAGATRQRVVLASSVTAGNKLLLLLLLLLKFSTETNTAVGIGGDLGRGRGCRARFGPRWSRVLF